MRRAARLKASSDELKTIIAAKSPAERAEAKAAAREAIKWSESPHTPPVSRQPLWWLRLRGYQTQLLIFAKRWRSFLILGAVVAIVAVTPPARQAVVNTTHHLKNFMKRLVSPQPIADDPQARRRAWPTVPGPGRGTGSSGHPADGLSPHQAALPGLPDGARTYHAASPAVLLRLAEPVDAVLSSLGGRCEWSVPSGSRMYAAAAGERRLVRLNPGADGTLPMVIRNTAGTLDKCVVAILPDHDPIGRRAATPTGHPSPRAEKPGRSSAAQPGHPAGLTSAAQTPPATKPGSRRHEAEAQVTDLGCGVLPDLGNLSSALCAAGDEPGGRRPS